MSLEYLNIQTNRQGLPIKILDFTYLVEEGRDGAWEIPQANPLC